MPNLGSFSGNPKTEWIPNPDGPDWDMKLLEDFSYTDPDGRVWPAPKESVVNGASIPEFLWAKVGSPYTDNYRNASIVHDVACEDDTVDRGEADSMFYYACRAGGCTVLEAWALYTGVRIGAWMSANEQAPPVPPGTPLFCCVNSIPTTAIDESAAMKQFEQITREVATLDTNAELKEIDAIIAKHTAID